MMNDVESPLCPFSKPLIGRYCQCPYAVLAERCSGKMVCSHDAQLRAGCEELVDLFKQKAHFVLGLSSIDAELTHAQSMKIRCGGLLGMQRVLAMDASKPPLVREVMDRAQMQYGSLSGFPYTEIMPDIQTFNHRRKTKKLT